MKAAFTICSANYLPQALSLEVSIKETNPDLSFIIFLTDKKPPFTTSPSIVEIDQVGFTEEHFNQLLSTYNIIEFNTSVKAQCFLYLFAKVKAEKVIYFDPDILVFQTLDVIWNELDIHNAVITPHQLQLIKQPELCYLTAGTINTGVFNLGFIALKQSEPTLAFVIWWNNHLKNNGHNNILNGEFYDQKVINLLPAVMDGVKIFKNPGVNVAEWNLHERELSFENGAYMVNKTFPLVFFHYSGVKITSAKQNLESNPLFAKAKSEALENLLDNYIQLNISNEYEKYRTIPCHYTLRPNIHRASRFEIYTYKLKSWLKLK